MRANALPILTLRGKMLGSAKSYGGPGQKPMQSIVSIVRLKPHVPSEGRQTGTLTAYSCSCASRLFQFFWLRRKDFFRSSRMRSKSVWPLSLRHAGFLVNQG